MTGIQIPRRNQRPARDAVPLPIVMNVSAMFPSLTTTRIRRFAFQRFSRCLATKSSKKSLTGTIKFFNYQRGFGFITPDDGSSKDVFLLKSAIKGDDCFLLDLRYGQIEGGERVTYRAIHKPGDKVVAADVYGEGKNTARDDSSTWDGYTPSYDERNDPWSQYFDPSLSYGVDPDSFRVDPIDWMLMNHQARIGRQRREWREFERELREGKWKKDGDDEDD